MNLVRRTLIEKVFSTQSRLACHATIMCIAYLAAVHCVGRAVQTDRNWDLKEVRSDFLLGLVSEVRSIPPLARWDSLWFYGVAQNGYTGEWQGKRSAPSFLPLYPLLMVAVGKAGRIDYLNSGLFISGAALWVSLLLLIAYVRDHGGSRRSARSALLVLLCFPSAFILASAYAESLFLALSLATFVLAHRGNNAAAAASAFCAGLTRNHGLALVAAMLTAGWQKRHSIGYSWRDYAPAMGGIAAYGLLAAYHWSSCSDPLRFLNAKRHRLGNALVPPWITLHDEFARIDGALENGGLGSLSVLLELPLVYVGVTACALFLMRKNWTEAVYTAGVLSMSLLSGSLWGLPRFFLILFPVFAIVAMSRGVTFWRPVYYLVGALLQACILINYVAFCEPPP